MLNYYPLWKYIMLILLLISSIIYALPNVYGEDPALQITNVRSSKVSESTLFKIRNILEKQNIAIKSITFEKEKILVRFYNFKTQLIARELLTNAFYDNYVIALNLAPATPKWLSMIGATPMRLGLDLRGGVYFLIEVDINTMLSKLQEQTIDNIRNNLIKNNTPYTIVCKTGQHYSKIIFRDTRTRDQALTFLRAYHHDLIININGNNALLVKISDNRLHQVRDSAVEQNIIIIRNRVNQLGITEPLVQKYGSNRIIVELPGVQDMARAKKILGSTASLEFRLVNNEVDQNIIVSGYVPKNSEVKFNYEGLPILLYKHVILTGNHITDSISEIDEYNRPQVNVFLDSDGGTIMSNFTKNNIGKQIATLFVEYKDSGKKNANGYSILEKQEKIINIATIKSQIFNTFRITGISNINEARQLSLLLKAGSLIAPIKIIAERTIGSTLGVHNINKGLEACVYGLVTSIIFMILWYHKFGLIAAIALIFNLILIVAIMSLLPGATLTMPGIAGIVLTLALVIDANVLINERIKEELRNGNKVQLSIHNGYQKAFPSIIDSNITTLITTYILYKIGSGSIKGFAITTAIGIVTSMFTAIICTRAFVNLIYGSRNIDKLSI